MVDLQRDAMDRGWPITMVQEFGPPPAPEPPAPAAAQAALMMAGLNGLSPVQAQAAMQELLQQQQQLMQQSAPQPRLRAPPPLKNMSSASRKPE